MKAFFRTLDSFGLDIRLGLRMMRKSWGLTLIGGLAMAVAISVGATAVAVLDAYDGDALPLDEGDRIVGLLNRTRTGGATTIQDFERWRDGMQSVKDISAFRTIERILVAADGSDLRVAVAAMTSSGFRVARVQPLVGRHLLEEDARAGATPVALIGYGLWQSRFAGDRGLLGNSIQLGGVDYVVVGIMPKDFAFPYNHQIWIPLPSNPLTEARQANARVSVFGRLAPDATIESAQAEISVLGHAPRDSQANQEIRTSVVRYANALVSGLAWLEIVPLLLTVLLIPPCTNIAILIYARNVTRQEEFAARHVLGAGRSRIVVQLLIEVLVLAAAAAGAGLLMADQFLTAFRRLVQDSPMFPFWVKPNISLETVLYVAGLAALAAMVAGGLPAMRATGRMRQSGFGALGSRTSPRLGVTWTVLVVAQVALSTAVLPRTGEMIWTQLQPNFIEREFAPEQYLTARIVFENEQPPAASVPAELVRRVKAGLGLSDVTASASTDGIDEAIRSVETEGGQTRFQAASNHIDETYFDVFKASLLTGRPFEPADFNSGRRVVIVNRTFAEQLSGQNPLGKRLRYLGGDGVSQGEPFYEIVGVVEQISTNTQRPAIYHPILADQIERLTLTLRAGPTIPSDFARRLLGVTSALDPNLQVEQLQTLRDMYQQERSSDNALGFVIGTPVIVVLLFSMAGIHTLVAFAVAQRRREIGIRSALGASPFRLVVDVFRRDLSPVLGGAVVGILLAFALDKLTRQAGDVTLTTLSISLAFLVMVAVGLLAVVGPARRLLRIDSTEALRG